MLSSPPYRLLAVAVMLTAPAVHASGYHFGTQSISAQSTANSSTAEAADASTLFYNPAGLTLLDDSQFSAALNIVSPKVTYDSASANYTNGNNVPGSTSGSLADDIVFAPHLYAAHKLNERTALGLGVYIPFASGTDYPQDSVLRYNLNQTELTTVAIEPAIAYQLTEKHAIAAGAIAQYASADLRKYADWGARLGASGAADGMAEVKLKDWGFGYHLAWMWDINDRTRLGLNYRSAIKHKLKGSANWSAVGPVAQQYSSLLQAPLSEGGAGYLPHENASINVTTPESVSLQGMYRATDKLKLFGDLTWTRHSRFNEGHLVFTNSKTTLSGGTSNETIIFPRWRNTYKISLGGAYQYSEPLQLRAGIAFDQSPIKSSDDRLVTLPDANRLWLSLGARYQLSPKHSIDLAYSRIHINKSSANASGGTTYVDSNINSSAKFSSSANIFGLQYNYRF